MTIQRVILLLILALATCPFLATTARILGVFPMPARSHMSVNSALVKELARRGHHVTVISPFPEKNAIPNYTNLQINLSMEESMSQLSAPSLYDLQSMTYLDTMSFLWNMGNFLCEKTLQSEPIQNLIHSTDLKFDLVIIGTFITDCTAALAYKFKAPLIQIVPFGGTGWMSTWTGNPHPLAYVPDLFKGFSDKMTFMERIENTLGEVINKITREIYFIPHQNALVKKYFNYTNDIPHISELLESTSLMLLNSHFSISYPRPLMPNVIQVGGLHVQPPKKLPKDLQDYLDNSPNGVIYFSFGSNLKSSELPESKRKAFLEVFSKLKQNILWKWEEDLLPGQPKNVKLGKWLPQSDILAHPNVRVFITHGGLLSSQETVHRGIPIIGIPFYGDQKLNMVRAVAAGYAVTLTFENVTTESLTWALKELLENPKYYENAQRLSRIFRDQPLTPMEQAVYWTEYVIRHKGAPHMRSAVLDLTWYQYFLLDVIAVMIVVACSVLLVIFLVLRTLFRICCGGTKRKTDISKKNKRE